MPMKKALKRLETLYPITWRKLEPKAREKPVRTIRMPHNSRATAPIRLINNCVAEMRLAFLELALGYDNQSGFGKLAGLSPRGVYWEQSALGVPSLNKLWMHITKK